MKYVTQGQGTSSFYTKCHQIYGLYSLYYEPHDMKNVDILLSSILIQNIFSLFLCLLQNDGYLNPGFRYLTYIKYGIRKGSVFLLTLFRLESLQLSKLEIFILQTAYQTRYVWKLQNRINKPKVYKTSPNRAGVAELH